MQRSARTRLDGAGPRDAGLPQFCAHETIACSRCSTRCLMQDITPPEFNFSPSNTTDPTVAAWQDLLAELTELHARLEYLRLLLKLGVRSL